MVQDKNRFNGVNQVPGLEKMSLTARNSILGNKHNRANDVHQQRKELNQVGSRFAVLRADNNNIDEILGEDSFHNEAGATNVELVTNLDTNLNPQNRGEEAGTGNNHQRVDLRVNDIEKSISQNGP